MEKLLVFIKGANNSYSNTASNLLGVHSVASAKVVVKFKSQDGNGLLDVITLAVTAGKENQMVEKISTNIAGSRSGKLVVADVLNQTGLEPAFITGITSISLGEGTNKIVEELTGAKSLTAADSGKVFMLNAPSSGVAATLPASTAISAGWNCRFIVKAASAAPYRISEDATVDTDVLVTSVVERTLSGNAQVMPYSAGHTNIDLRAGTSVKGDSVTIVFDGVNFYADAISANGGGIVLQ